MKKFILLLTTLVLLFTCCFNFLACSGNTEQTNSENDLNISVWKNGSMTEATINKLADAFKKKYPQYNVNLDISGDQTRFSSNIKLGAEYNPYDLFFTSKPEISEEQYLLSLDSILTDDNNKNLNKFETSILDSIRTSSGYKYLPYVNNWLGICYNSNIIDGVKYKVPRTTDELEILVSSIIDKEKTIKPFIHFKTEGYWTQLIPLWQIQYDGLDYYKNNFLMLKDLSGNSPSKEIATKKDGRYQALAVMDGIISSESCFPGSNSMAFGDAQTWFLDGKVAMMVNGTWLANETGEDCSMMKMMKIPVISSITDRTTSIDSDEELQSLIDAIDVAGSDKSLVSTSGVGYNVCQDDIDIVYEARNYTCSICDDNVACIPNYANAKDAAVAFLKFLFEDEQIKLYADDTHLPLPYKTTYTDSFVNTSSYSNWEKNLNEKRNSAVPIIIKGFEKNVLFVKGGATPYGIASPASSFNQVSSSRQDLESLWNSLVGTFNDNWNNYLSNAGLK